ncbi:MAG: SDR family NAD(P)-dependent oxidoreductase [bacterium]|nr:SDR family NAD(P)-dependent oxidoreductase [bacterium]
MKSFFQALDHILDKTVLFGYDRVGYYLRRPLWEESETDVSLKGKIALVTGANSGLGRATAEALALRGARVYLLCRNRERGDAARTQIVQATGNEDVHLELADLASQKQIRAFAEDFQKREPRLDILVNNAGILPDERSLTEDGIESTFAVNTLAYFLLTNLLSPALEVADGARVINVSSGGQYLADLDVNDLQFAQGQFDGTKAYAATKRAELLLTLIWSDWYRERGVLVFGMHPGWADTPAVQTSLPTFRAIMQLTLRTPAEGADTIVWLCANPKLGAAESGGFFFDRRARPIIRVEKTRNSPEEVASLWRQCAELTNYEGPIKPDAEAFERAASRE